MKTVNISDEAHAVLVKEQASHSLKKGDKKPLSFILDKLLKIKKGE